MEYPDQYAEWLTDDAVGLGYAGMGIMPEHTKDGMRRYIVQGLDPGGFLTACLIGDLYLAVRTADTVNSRNLHAIVEWIMYYAPPGCYGSEAKVANWSKDVDQVRSSYVQWLKKREVWHLMLNTR